MRTRSIAATALLCLMSMSCGGGGSGLSVWPTERDINTSLQDIIRSVAGDWTGTANAPNAFRLEFRLQESANGQVSGTGSMKEDSAAAAVPITITGTFQRPLLSLTIEAMVLEGRQLRGVAQGSYDTIGGVATTMTLTAPGFTRAVPILLQEKG